MAHSIAPATLQIKRRFAQLIPDDVIVDACCQAAHRWRARRFDPIATIHLFVLQVLNGNTAILHLRHLVCSSLNAAAYCRARMRLPLAVYETLLDYTARVAAQGARRSSRRCVCSWSTAPPPWRPTPRRSASCFISLPT